MYPLAIIYRMLQGTYPGNTPELWLQVDHASLSPRMKRVRADATKLASLYPVFFTIVNEGSTKERSGGDYLRITGLSHKPSLIHLADELGTDQLQHGGASRMGHAASELLASVLVKGEVFGDYGSYYTQDQADVLHLLTCGIDWSRYAGVTSERWREWGGTFAEDDYLDKLEARLTCRCDEGVEVLFGLTPPSLGRLMVVLSADQLDKLWEK